MGPKNAKRSNRQLGKEIVGLQRAFESLERRLSREVRTRSLIIESPDGFRRIVATADNRGAQVLVRTRSEDEVITCAELFANEVDPGTEHVGLALTRRGDVVAALDATDGGDPRVWIDDDAQVP